MLFSVVYTLFSVVYMLLHIKYIFVWAVKYWITCSPELLVAVAMSKVRPGIFLRQKNLSCLKENFVPRVRSLYVKSASLLFLYSSICR